MTASDRDRKAAQRGIARVDSRDPAAFANGAMAETQRILRLMHQIEQIAGIGSWEWHPDDDELVVSDNLLRLVGLAPGSIQPTLTGALQRTHPDDRDRLSGLLERARLADSPASIDLRVLRPDGAIVHLRVSAPVLDREPSGRRRVVGFVADLATRRSPRGSVPAEPAAILTARERQVLQLAADGRSTRDVAEQLFLSPGTVKTHFHHIYAKLGVPDRAAAVAHAMRSGLIN